MSSAIKYYDRVMETSTTTGTGTYTLAGATTGYQGFSAVGDGNTCYYNAMEVDANGNPSGGWEVGKGTYTSAGTTLSRDSIVVSSNANAAVNWAAGTRRLFLVAPAKFVTTDLFGYPSQGVLLPNAKGKHVYSTNLTTGDTDVYTVPTGKRFLLTGVWVYNSSGGNITWYPEAKVSATYYRLASNSTTATVAITNLGNMGGYVLDAGESLSFNTATNNGLDVHVHGIEFDSTGFLKGLRSLGPATGDNTMYTCPAGYYACILGPAGGLPIIMSQSFNATAYECIADAGGTRVFKLQLVPTGQAANAKHQIATVTAGASTRGTLNISQQFYMEVGDFLNLNLDTGNAGESFWGTILEIPLPV